MGQITPAPRPIPSGGAVDAAKPLLTDLQTVLGTVGDVFVDRPGFVASNEDVNPLSTAVRAVTRLNCRLWAARDKSGYSNRVNAYNSQVCGPYLESIGEGVQEGKIGPQFQGGQCPQLYQILIKGDPSVPGGIGQINSNFKTWGPIEGWRSTRDGVRIKAFIRSSGSITGSSCSVSGGAPGVMAERQVFDVADRNQRDLTFQITGICAGVDNCGNPPSVITPPGSPRNPPTVPPNITINIPGIGPVNVGVTLSPTGDPTINLPDLGIETTINLGGDDGGGDGGGGAPTPGDETDPGAAGNPASTGDGGDAQGAAGAGEELVGVLVEVTSTTGDPNVFANVAETVYRGVGYVRMGYLGRLGLDISGGTVISPQFFHAQQRGLTHWAVRANVGFNIRATPYYRDLES